MFFREIFFLMPNKTLIKILYSGLGTSVYTWKLECNNEIGVHKKMNDKNNKKCKRLQLQGENRGIRINYLKKKEELELWK